MKYWLNFVKVMNPKNIRGAKGEIAFQTIVLFILALLFLVWGVFYIIRLKTSSEESKDQIVGLFKK
jgi:hypothetical protein